jgi:hypothetical protein
LGDCQIDIYGSRNSEVTEGINDLKLDFDGMQAEKLDESAIEIRLSRVV